jgi:uncharacterized protein YuzE
MIRVGDELNVDIDATGAIYGIELLNANVQLAEGKSIVVENKATGSREKPPLAG